MPASPHTVRRGVGGFLARSADRRDLELRRRAQAGIWAIDSKPRLALAPTMPTRTLLSVAINPSAMLHSIRCMVGSFVRDVRRKTALSGCRPSPEPPRPDDAKGVTGARFACVRVRSQNSPLRYASSRRRASSSDGSSQASPRRRSAPVKSGGRFPLKPRALLAVGRHLDQQIVDQVLHVPGLIGRKIAETHHKLLHHAHRHRRHLDDMAGDRLRPLHQLGVRHHLVDEPDARPLRRVDRIVGQQHLHRVDIAELLDQEAGTRPVAETALGGQGDLNRACSALAIRMSVEASRI